MEMIRYRLLGQAIEISQNEHAALAGSVARLVLAGNKYVFEEETEIAVRIKSW